MTELAPLTKRARVTLPPDRAFALFTEGIDSWWPATSHSIGEDQVVEVVFEARLGGRIYERLHDGTQHDWGEVTAWEPPHLFVCTWNPTTESRPPTELEVRFVAEGDRTLVELEHRHWERLGDRGAVLRAQYDPGWDYVFGLYLKRAG
ncbi:MAG: SRPBCC domain-containing protein [Actinomycetota bacterium]